MKPHVFALSMAGLLLLALGGQAPATPSDRDAAPDPQAVTQVTATAEAATGASRRVDDETARLRAALSAPRPFTSPARNPFAFHRPAPRPTPAAARAAAAMPSANLAPTAPDAAARPVAPTLVAIVADARPGGVVRTVLLSFDGETALVAVGETFGSFRVKAISDATVDLVDLAAPAHAVRTLSIR